MPKLKQTKMYWPVTKGYKVLVSPVRGLLAGPPFTDRVQRKKGSEKTLGGPEAGSNGGGCGGGCGGRPKRHCVTRQGPREGLG